jgi:hypothetical protein
MLWEEQVGGDGLRFGKWHFNLGHPPHCHVPSEHELTARFIEFVHFVRKSEARIPPALEGDRPSRNSDNDG